MINIYLILLLFQLRFLNFIENIGTSETSRYENNAISAMMRNQPAFKPHSHSPPPVTSADQKRAFAGVGKPIKVVVWRVSILNLAKRHAEKTAMRNAV